MALLGGFEAGPDLAADEALTEATSLGGNRILASKFPASLTDSDSLER